MARLPASGTSAFGRKPPCGHRTDAEPRVQAHKKPVQLAHATQPGCLRIILRRSYGCDRFPHASFVASMTGLLPWTTCAALLPAPAASSVPARHPP